MCENEIKEYINNLVDKSIEAYLMSLEIINKPTIKYRTEGFCFFICNAWELLLKAWLVNTKSSIDAIYYRDKKPKRRSISLQDCIKKYRTREDDPLRVNLSFIKMIRNTGTHDVVSGLDFQLAGVFQTCVENYCYVLRKEFPVAATSIGMEPFVSLASLPETEIQSTLFYNIETQNTIESIMNEKIEKGILEQNIMISKSPKNSPADLSFRIASDGEIPVQLIVEPKDVNGFYALTAREVVNKTLNLLRTAYPDPHFTSYSFDKICKLKNIKNNKEYTYYVKNGKNGHYKYSEKLPLYIATLLEDEKNYIDLLPMSKRKEETPGEANSRL